MRCLLSLNEVKEASALIAEVKANPSYLKTNIIGANDIYTNAILGFYEGQSYDHCLQLFKSIRPKGEYTKEVRDSKTREEEWKLIQNSKCYSAVIGSCFYLKDYAAVQYFYHECRRMGVFPNYVESLMMAQSFLYMAKGESQPSDTAGVLKGIPEAER